MIKEWKFEERLAHGSYKEEENKIRIQTIETKMKIILHGQEIKFEKLSTKWVYILLIQVILHDVTHGSSSHLFRNIYIFNIYLSQWWCQHYGICDR